MASACVNNIAMSPETTTFFPWEPEPDFEFRLQDPVTMLPADQLFSDGKLVPLHLKPTTTTSPQKKITTSIITSSDPILFSPKAPRCSSRWKDLLGLKKLYNNSTNHQTKSTTMASSSSSSSSANKSFKQLLHRSTKTTSSENASLNLPLLRDSDNESLSISSRLSLSSSSSSHDHDDLPRLSLDSEKPNPISLHRNPNPIPNPNPRIRLVKPKPSSGSGSFDGGSKTDQLINNRVGRSPIRMESSSSSSNAQGCRGVSVDSPRLNSSGKIVFQSLERSSSSPGSFTGGPRFKHRGMERSYSANVRVTPVLNVPVCSLKSGSVFGFGQLFSSPQKRESTIGGVNSKNHHHYHQQHQHSVRNQQQKQQQQQHS